MGKASVRREAPGGNTVALDAHALGTLRYIRASIDAARLLAVPGSAGVAMGSVGLIAAVLAAQPVLASRWLDIWLGAGMAAFLCGSASAQTPSSANAKPMTPTSRIVCVLAAATPQP